MGKRKSPAGDTNPNHDFCVFLTELADYEKNVTRNIYKHNAYRKAASILASYPTRIKSGKEVRKITGIGERIGKKIDEFLQAGKMRKLDEMENSEKSAALEVLSQVSGIGIAKAQSLVALGIRNLDDLHENLDKLNHHQIIGLKYYQDFKQKIPRKEIQVIELIMRQNIYQIDPLIELTICGSYRRGKDSIKGEIDALITHINCSSIGNGATEYQGATEAHTALLKKVVKTLKSCGLITDTLFLGDSKFMGACRLNGDAVTRRLDIRVCPYDQFYCSVLYSTGPELFCGEMRKHAEKSGFLLDENSLRPSAEAEAIKINSEKEIFELIGYPYREPKDRG